MGRVSNLVAINKARARPLAVRFWSRVHKNRGCWIWAGSRNRRGYGTLRRGEGESRTAPPALAHRIAWELERGAIPLGLHVLHRCDNPACVRVEHLFLGTDLDNVRDMDRKGRRVNANQKMTPSDHAEAIERRRRGESHRAIAEALGFSDATIGRFLRSLR